MSDNVDERVVSMRFDNEQFERGIHETLDSLEELEEGLKLDGASAGIETASASMGKMSGYARDAASNVSDAFSNMGSAARSFADFTQGAFENVSLKAVALYKIFDSLIDKVGELGKKAFNSLGINSGFSEYELKIGSIQTILANTGESIENVSDCLDDLNRYADKTIYNFAQMTANIGRFTSAGVELKDATDAIKGISNLAAFSGANAAQASNVMYQTSQALSSGTFRLQDWNSFVNSGMSNKTFQDLLVQQATKMGVTAEITVETPGKNGKTTKSKKTVTAAEYVAEKGFRDSLAGGWLTKDVMLSTLRIFSGEMTEAEMKSYGYTEAEIARLKEIGQTATDAATKVRTFSQLLDTTKEALQSGWTESWEILIGDFYEATDLLTKISDFIGGIIQKTSDARNELLKGWKDLGGRDQLIKDLANLVDMLKTVGKAIYGAFADVFFHPDGIGTSIFNPKAFKKFTDSIGEAIKKFKAFLMAANSGTYTGTILYDIVYAIRGVNAGLRIAFDVLKAIGRVLGATVWPILKTVFTGVTSLLASFGDKVYKFSESLRTNKTLEKFTNSIREKVAPTIERITNSIEGFFNRLRQGTGFLGTIVKAIKDKFHELFDNKQTNEKATVFSVIGKALSWIGRKLSEFYHNPIVQNVLGQLKALKDRVTSYIQDWFASGGFSRFVDRVKEIAKNVGQSFKQLWSSFSNTKVYQKVTDWFKTFDLGKTFDNIVAMFKNVKTGKVFSSITGFFKGLNFERVSSTIADLVKKVKTGVLSVWGAVKEFLSSFFSGAKNSGKMAENASGSIEKVENVAEKVGNVVEKVDSATGKFSSIAGNGLNNIGTFFSNVGTFLTGLWNNVKGLVGSINLDKIDAFAYKITSIAAPVVLLNWINSLSKVNKNFGKTLKESSKVIRGFRGAGGSFKGLLDSITGLFSGQHGSVKELLTDFGKDGGIMKALSNVFGKKDDENETVIKHVDSIGTTVLKFAGAIAILVGALYVLTNVIDQKNLTSGLIALGLVMVGFAGFVAVLALVDKKLGSIDNIGNGALKLAAAVGVMIGALYLLTKFSEDDYYRGAQRLVAIALAMSLFMTIIAASGYNGKQTKVLSFALGILVLVYSLRKAAMLSTGEFLRGMYRLALIMLTLGGSMAIAGKAEGGVKGAFSVAVAALILGKVLKSLAQLNIGQLAVGIAGLLGILLPLALFLRTAGKQDFKLSQAVGLALLVSALSKIVMTLGTFATTSPLSILAGVAALGLVLWELKAFLKATATDTDEKKVKGLIPVAIAMIAMIIPVKALGKMDLASLAKGVGGLSVVLMAIGGMFRLAGSNTISAGAVLSVALVLVAMLIPIKALARMPLDEYAKGVGGVSLIIGMISLMVHQFGKIDKTGVVAMGLGLVLFGGVIYLLMMVIDQLGKYNSYQVMAGLLGIAAIFLGFALVVRSAKGLDKVTKIVGLVLGVAALSGAILVMCYSLNMLRGYDTETMKVALIGMAGMIAVIAIITGILGAMKTSILGSVGLLLACIGVAALFVAMCYALNMLKGFDLDKVGDILWKFAILLAVVTAVAIVAGKMPAAAIIGALIILGVIAVLGLIAYALGNLSDGPGVIKKIQAGGDVLYAIGEAISKLFSGLTSLNNGRAQQLNQFITDIQPFLEEAAKIKPEVSSGIGYLCSALLQITGTEVVTALANFLTFGDTIKAFCQHVVSLGSSMSLFNLMTSSIDPEKIKGIAGAAEVLTDALTVDGTIQDIGPAITGLGSGLENLNTNLSKISDFTKVESAFGCIGTFAGYATDLNTIANLPSISGKLSEVGSEIQGYADLVKGPGDAPEDGFIQNALDSVSIVTGLAAAAKDIEDVDISSFSALADTLVAVGGGVKLYADAIGGIEAITEIEGKEVDAIELVRRLIEAIPDDFTSLVTKIPDENGMNSFSTGIVGLGGALVAFSETTADVDQGNIDKAVACLDALTKVNDNLPKVGGLLDTIFGETVDPYQFSSGLRSLGSGLSAFYSYTSDLDAAKITEAAGTLSALGEIEKNLEAHGGIVQYFAGEKDFTKFGTGLTAVGTGLQNFVASTAGIETGDTENATNLIGVLADLEHTLKEHGSIFDSLVGDASYETFAPGVLALGTALGDFNTSIADLNATKAGEAVTIIDNLAAIENKLKQHGGIKTWFTGDSSLENFSSDIEKLGAGLKSFSDNSKNLNYLDSLKAVSVGNCLKDLHNTLTGTGGVLQWITGEQNLSQFAQGVKDLGGALKQFSDDSATLVKTNCDKSIEVASVLNTLNHDLVETGGAWNWITGEKSFSSFAQGIKDLGGALKQFSDDSASMNPTNCNKSVGVAEELNNLNKKLVKNDGAFKWLTGTQDLGNFATGIKSLSDALIQFCTDSEGLDPSKTQASIDVAGKLNELEQALPRGGVLENNFLSKRTTLTDFTSNFNKLALDLMGFQDKIAGFDTNSFYKVTAGLRLIVEAAAIGRNVNAGSSINNIGNLLQGIGEAFSDEGQLYDLLYDTGLSNGVTYADGLVDGMTSMKDYVGSQMKITGQFFVQGMIDGLDDKSSDLYNKVIEIAEASIAKFNEALDEHSPSELTKKSGMNFVKGAEIGVDSEAKAFYDQIDEISQNALKSFKQIEDPGTSFFGGLIEESYVAEERMGDMFGNLGAVSSDTFGGIGDEAKSLFSDVDFSGLNAGEILGGDGLNLGEMNVGSMLGGDGLNIEGIFGGDGFDLSGVKDTMSGALGDLGGMFDMNLGDVPKMVNEGAANLVGMFNSSQLQDIMTIFNKGLPFDETLKEIKELIAKWVKEGTFTGKIGEGELGSWLLNMFNREGRDLNVTSIGTSGTPTGENGAAGPGSGAKGAKTGKTWWGVGWHYGIGTDNHLYWASYDSIPDEYKGKAVFREDAWIEEKGAANVTAKANEAVDATKTATASAIETLGTMSQEAFNALTMSFERSEVLSRGKGPLALEYANKSADEIARELGLQTSLAQDQRDNLSSLESSLKTNVDQVKSLAADSTAVANAVASLTNKVGSLRVYLDTGALVGEMTPLIDASLGDLYRNTFWR